jgi:hypothetical protein
MSLIFKKIPDLLKYLSNKKTNSPVLLVIPAISMGTTELNNQYRDYLDQSANVYRYLDAKNLNIKIFALGANHRGDGFLHQKGKKYLIEKYQIPESSFVGKDENFEKLGLCSVEEVQLLKYYLNSISEKFYIVTCISQTQQIRYELHEEGYGISSLYFIFPDNPDYYHVQSNNQEELLMQFTKQDPTWESKTGLELRNLAHRLRDPHELPPSAAEIQDVLSKLKNKFTEE